MKIGAWNIKGLNKELKQKTVADLFQKQRLCHGKQGGLPVTTYITSDFQEFVLQARMEDLHSLGCHYTWTNGHICCKLD